jgi:hypothetical protein
VSLKETTGKGQWALTNWRAQNKRQVKISKETKWARGTHKLESTEVDIS